MENPAKKDPLDRQGSEIPSGSALDRGMCVEKRTNDRPEVGGTLNSGGPESHPKETIYLHGDCSEQRKEDADRRHRESDLPIVVRDGRADHMAKEQAERQSRDSTHARERITPVQSVSSTLSALRAKAEKDRKHRFRGLARLLNHQMLAEAFGCLKRKAAPGIDGVVHAEYAENLEANLMDLEKRLKDGRYRARCVKRHWIPKAGGKLRPLGIPVLEDKIVQQAVKMILESIWEPVFYDESIGYRPGIGAREAGKELRNDLNTGCYSWVVEADIRAFFDRMDHGWLVRMLEERIADKSLIRLVVKWLKAGVMEEGSKVIHPATGTPQGGVISPILANIYLHYVLDHWIKLVVCKHTGGRVLFRRYADDIVVAFESEKHARAYLGVLPKRLEKFGLELAEEKSSLVRFERSNPDISGKFTFLGFDFYWARSKRHERYTYVRRRTNQGKFRASLLAMKEWIKKVRHHKLRDLLVVLRRKMRGWFNYYGVIGNSRMIASYEYEVKRMIYKWLNRRSQRRSFTWAEYARAWERWEMPPARVIERV